MAVLVAQRYARAAGHGQVISTQKTKPRLVVCRGAAQSTGGSRSAARAPTPPQAIASGLLQQGAQANSQKSWWQRLLPGPREQQTLEEEAIRQVTEAELESLLASAEVSGRPLVVVFSAHWCGPCKLLTKQLIMVHSDMRAAGSHFDLVKVEAPEEDALSTRLRVYQLPCTFFVGGKGSNAPALRMEGLLSPSVIEEAVRGKSAALGSSLKRAILL